MRADDINRFPSAAFRYISVNFHVSKKTAFMYFQRELNYLCNDLGCGSNLRAASVFMGKVCELHDKTTRDLDKARFYNDVFFYERENEYDLKQLCINHLDVHASVILYAANRYNLSAKEMENSALGPLLVYFVDLYLKRKKRFMDLMDYDIVKWHVDNGEFTYDPDTKGVMFSWKSCKMLQTVMYGLPALVSCMVVLNSTNSIGCFVTLDDRTSYVLEDDLFSAHLVSTDSLKQHIVDIIIALEADELDEHPNISVAVK